MARCGVITRAACGRPWNAETVTKPGETTAAGGATATRWAGGPPPALTNTRPWAAVLAVTSMTIQKARARGKRSRMTGLFPNTTSTLQGHAVLLFIEDALARTEIPAHTADYSDTCFQQVFMYISG